MHLIFNSNLNHTFKYLSKIKYLAYDNPLIISNDVKGVQDISNMHFNTCMYTKEINFENLITVCNYHDYSLGILDSCIDLYF